MGNEWGEELLAMSSLGIQLRKPTLCGDNGCIETVNLLNEEIDDKRERQGMSRMSSSE